MAKSRQCPTRVDHADPLIAHSISIPLCVRRQRERYHKCYTCVHAQIGAAVPRSTAATEVALPERPAPSVETPQPAVTTTEGAA